MDKLIEEVTELFDRLRQAGLPLGIDQYMLLIQALRLGHGLSDRAALERLCKLIWLVATTDELLFDHLFAVAIKVQLPLKTTLPKRKKSESALPKITPPPRKPPALPELPKKPPKASLPRLPSLSPPKQLPSLPEPPPVPPVEDIISAGPGRIQKEERRREASQAVELAQSAEDVTTNVRSVLHMTDQVTEIFSGNYQLSANYLPVSRRQMKQSWRYLRRMVRVGPPVVLDVQATIRQIGRRGRLVEPVMRPRRINQAALLLLVDQNGSMIPFHSLARALVETAASSGCFGRADVYYFHNVPPLNQDATVKSGDDFYRDHILFQKPQCVEAQPVHDIMAELQYARADVLVFSDAGAARGGWNEDRIQNTALFLYQLRALGAAQFSWLNPMPQDRWADTSAEAIADFIPMFNANHRGLNQAIGVLRSDSRFTLSF